MRLLTRAEYDRDDGHETEGPSLRQSLVRTLLSESPAQAKAEWESGTIAHLVEPASTRASFGLTVHALIAGDPVVAIDADDYRSGWARLARDAALRDGAIPILKSDWNAVESAATAIKARIHPEAKHEIGLTWRCDWTGCRARARLDAIRVDEASKTVQVWDYKTTTVAASDWANHAARMGYHVQAAAYSEAASVLYGGYRVDYRLVVCPSDPAYIYEATFDAAFLGLGQQIWARAKERWAEYAKSGQWPGPGAVVLPAPKWLLLQEDEL